VGFQVPLSLFGVKGAKSAKRPSQPVTVSANPTPKEEVYYKTDCYTLQEIQKLINEGKSVVGKTICAIDAVNFDTAKSTIKSESKGYLNQIADVLIETGLRVEIKGHTDYVGTEESNMQLSKDRALAIKSYLEQRGVEPSKITYSYYGESRPMDTNETPEGRLRNRRVEFELLKK
jgi:OOP family OmpA-OmpF porin